LTLNKLSWGEVNYKSVALATELRRKKFEIKILQGVEVPLRQNYFFMQILQAENLGIDKIMIEA